MYQIACDIHPIQNLRVTKYVGNLAGDDKKIEWMRHWIVVGFEG